MTETATTETRAPKTKNAATPKGAKTRPPKAAKSKKEKPTEPLMTFALRLPKSESAAFHAAAGKAAASRTARALIAAFVAGDGAQFEAIVDEARKLQ
jgi:thiol:disulfide interchange protein